MLSVCLSVCVCMCICVSISSKIARCFPLTRFCDFYFIVYSFPCILPMPSYG